MQFELRIVIKNNNYEQKDNKQANNDKEMFSNDRYNPLRKNKKSFYRGRNFSNFSVKLKGKSGEYKQKNANLFDFISYNDLENSIKDIVYNTFSDNMDNMKSDKSPATRAEEIKSKRKSKQVIYFPVQVEVSNNLNRFKTFQNSSDNDSIEPVNETLTNKEKSGINKTIIVNRSYCSLSNQ